MAHHLGNNLIATKFWLFVSYKQKIVPKYVQAIKFIEKNISRTILKKVFDIRMPMTEVIASNLNEWDFIK